MLKPQNRLKNNHAFLATYKQRQVFGNNFFTAYLGRLLVKEARMPLRIGFVVSNKVHKRAVKRNRLKRLMRESLRLIIKNEAQGKENILGALGEFQSIVIVAKESAPGLDFKCVDEQIKILLEGLRKNFAKHVK